FIYFNRTDVQETLHVPPTNWESCSSGSVYINRSSGGSGRDQSIASTLREIPDVIEKS
ncbi:hypothetical protein MPER_13309, partial [Moniliophthora perniciosa FA553]